MGASAVHYISSVVDGGRIPCQLLGVPLGSHIRTQCRPIIIHIYFIYFNMGKSSVTHHKSTLLYKIAVLEPH